MRRSQNLEIVVFSVKKNLHKALRSVQFLASFISFYFEILSYLACGEKIIRLASKNSVKLDEKSASDIYIYIYKYGLGNQNMTTVGFTLQICFMRYSVYLTHQGYG